MRLLVLLSCGWYGGARGSVCLILLMAWMLHCECVERVLRCCFTRSITGRGGVYCQVVLHKRRCAERTGSTLPC